MRPAGNPVLDPLEVEADQLLVVDVGQRVEGAQLLDVLAVSGSLVVSRHDAVEGPVGAAAEGQPDDDVASVVMLQQQRG